MGLTRTLFIDGRAHDIFISDDIEALSKAHALGRAILGIWNPKTMKDQTCPANYLVECLEAVDEELLERVLRRHLNLPWEITDTSRLWIREWTLEDIPYILIEEDDTEGETMFHQPDTMAAYIKEQYGFCEYGIWALKEKSTGILVGMAGLLDLELPENGMGLALGYHIFQPYRRKGYAVEAGRAILRYAKDYLDAEIVYANIDASNEASIHIVQRLGFHIIQTYSEAGKCMHFYGWYCLETQPEEE